MSIINIKDSNISGGSILGDHNNIFSGLETGVLNWERIQNELLQAIKDLPVDSKESQACQGILPSVLNKDSASFLSGIARFASAFSSSLFANVAGKYLLDVLGK